MSEIANHESPHQASSSCGSSDRSDIKISRQAVIGSGVKALQQIGSAAICTICIGYGGSCCYGCRHLADGIGCRQRNTSCTAWLCGFLKLLLLETGLLEEWNDYWDQVPGQDFRKDFTPDEFFMNRPLRLPNLRRLSEALADDLKDLEDAHIANGFILTLREKIDKNIDLLEGYRGNAIKQNRMRKNIAILSSPFYRFQQELRDYRRSDPVR
ncbi:hypothetical protein GXP70_22525 [Paenibacillus lycopersici]|uniref:DNA mismatch repair protein n=1 Tax=Paenibacillus lycopersici TaxID=2704462 RepID=A0A6C0FZF5_9BACL|nr:hypothetical protein [Paenibacillus lycopersici]QHT62486.1 hypothetical protein GXP70_22525 [Paenibacillus lycopersici]